MHHEPTIIITFLYKRSGKQKLTKQELLIPLCLDLNWFKRPDGQRFLTYVQQKNLLKQNKDNTYSPTFNIEEVTIPTGFHPTTKTYTSASETTASPKPDLFTTIVRTISTALKTSEKQIQNDIHAIADEKHITPEVAAAYYAKIQGIDLSAISQQIHAALTQENEQ